MNLLTAIRKIEDKCGDYESTGDDSLFLYCGFCGRDIAEPNRDIHMKGCPFTVLYETASKLFPE